MAFLIGTSYKSVLRALLMKKEYESTIDTIDELLESDRILELPEDTPLKYLLDSDPRDKVKRMKEKTKFHIMGVSPPESLAKR